MSALRDEFLSEEDLDLRHLTQTELLAWWTLWLREAQTTNGEDERTYAHGVFATVEPPFLEPGRGRPAARPGV